MNTPVADFVRRYGEGDTARLHMPGHKGRPFLGCEPWDLTEIPGADALYQAQGILRESEANAAALFGSQRTCYSTEGSSQCLRAMLYLACCGTGSRRVVAARNVHSAFVSAAALLDLEVTWLWPEESRSLCGCPVSPAQLEETLSRLPEPPAAVYLTSPDYLGAMAELPVTSQGRVNRLTRPMTRTAGQTTANCFHMERKSYFKSFHSIRTRLLPWAGRGTRPGTGRPRSCPSFPGCRPRCRGG